MLLSEEATSVFQGYTQDEASKLEAGGILLGKRRRNHFEIMHVTEPTEFDERSRTHWVRSEKTHADIAKHYWTESGGEITYLGEWHTHPEAIPSPSKIDLDEWEILSHNCSHPGGMSMIIVGVEDIWCGIAQKKVITKMDKIN
jgi:integrative and conjugative element protein (TIGR02256 family)